MAAIKLPSFLLFIHLAHIDIRAADKCKDSVEERNDALNKAVAMLLAAEFTKLSFRNEIIHITGRTNTDVVQVNRCGYILYLSVIGNSHCFSAVGITVAQPPRSNVRITAVSALVKALTFCVIGSGCFSRIISHICFSKTVVFVGNICH